MRNLYIQKLYIQSLCLYNMLRLESSACLALRVRDGLLHLQGRNVGKNAVLCDLSV